MPGKNNDFTFVAQRIFQMTKGLFRVTRTTMEPIDGKSSRRTVQPAVRGGRLSSKSGGVFPPAPGIVAEVAGV